MKSMHLLLNEAEHAWREDVRRDFPLRSDTKLLKQKAIRHSKALANCIRVKKPEQHL